jgi:hypothetical protein
MSNRNDAEKETTQDGGGGFFAGFLFGAIAGAVAAYVLMHDEARDAIVGKAREATTTLQTNAADLYARGKTVVENARSNVNAAVDEGQSTADRLREELSRESVSQSSVTNQSTI